MLSRSLVLVVLVAVAACGGEPLELAPWAFDVPEGTLVVEHAQPGDRGAIELTEDLVITGSGAEDGPFFFFPGYFSQVVGVTPDGHLHVLDVGAQQVERFDRHGHHLGAMGRRGQGPGEFSRASKITVAGGELVIADFAQQLLSVWGLDGEHRSAASLEVARSYDRLEGIAGGTFIASYTVSHDDGTRERRVVRLDHYSDEAVRLAAGSGGRWERVDIGDGRTLTVRHDVGVADFVTSPDGTVYVTPGDRYQLYAYSPDGDLHWAMRMARPARPFPEDSVRRTVEDLREGHPDLAADGIAWPEVEPVIERISVDGKGRVWVLPYRSPAELEEESLRPVDVFSADGELLYSGLIDGLWQQAHGDYVFRLEESPETGDWQVVRYLLRTPF